jgi:hypothetical protein
MLKSSQKKKEDMMHIVGYIINVKVHFISENNESEYDTKIYVVECPYCGHKCYGLTEIEALRMLMDHMNIKYSEGAGEMFSRKLRSYVDFPK